MQLVYYPSNLLLKICHPVQEISRHSHHTTSERKKIQRDRKKLAVEMWKIMDDHGGVGLAAPQVGLNIRVFVWNQRRGYGRAIWNPVLNCVSGCTESKEGCLSLPEVSVTVKRAKVSILTGTGLYGKPLRFIGNSITTPIFQHELDHLNGKLIIHNMDYNNVVANQDAIKGLLKNAGEKDD